MSDAVTDKFDVKVTNADSVSAGCDACPSSVDICGAGKKCNVAQGW